MLHNLDVRVVLNLETIFLPTVMAKAQLTLPMTATLLVFVFVTIRMTCCMETE
jgi:hypothetical protein